MIIMMSSVSVFPHNIASCMPVTNEWQVNNSKVTTEQILQWRLNVVLYNVIPAGTQAN